MTALAAKPEKVARVVPNAPWPLVPLGEIAEVKLGKMLDKKRTGGRLLPYLRNINVRWGSVDTNDLLEMPFEDDELDRFGLKDGDVLVCEGGEPGRAAVWNAEIPNLKFQKALHRVRFRVPYEPRLLVLFLELLAKTGGLERRFTGSTIKHFTREAFLQLPVPNPPLPEQRRIVAEMEQQFTRLDAGVAALRRTQANLKRYRAAVLKAACEGRLVPTEAELARKNARVLGSIPTGDFDSPSHGSNPQSGKRGSIPRRGNGVQEVVSSGLTSPTSYETGEQLLARILNERRKNWQGRAKYKEPGALDSAISQPPPEGWTWATVEQLLRDPRVRAAVLRRSGPRCERCGLEQSFPGFFDVHHILGAENGDRVWNCVTLCPNCHREAHFHPDQHRINTQLLIFASEFKP